MNYFKNLADIDYEILAFIKKNNPVHLSKILKKFPEKKYTTKYRLNFLSTYSIDETPLIKEEFITNEKEDNYWDIGVSTNVFSITKKGLKLLSDYNLFCKNESTKEIRTLILYPIISAAITAMIVSYITTHIILKF